MRLSLLRNAMLSVVMTGVALGTSARALDAQVAVPTAIQSMQELQLRSDFGKLRQYNSLMRQANSARAAAAARTRKGLFHAVMGSALTLAGIIGVSEGGDNDAVTMGGAAALGVGVVQFSWQFDHYRRARRERDYERQALAEAQQLGLRFQAPRESPR